MTLRLASISSGCPSIRLSDPFGFVELTRSFQSRASLVVTPAVQPLPLDVIPMIFGQHSVGASPTGSPGESRRSS